MATKLANKIRIPKLRECNGRACADFRRKRIYFGKPGSKEAEAKYRRVVAEYVAHSGSFPLESGGATVAELILEYWRDRKEYFRKPDGTHTSSLECIRQAMKPLKNLYADCLANDFGPGDLRTIRQGWIEKGLSRKTINDYTSAVKRLFKWCVSHELVESSVYHSLVV